MTALADQITFTHLHHAYLIEGERNVVKEELFALFHAAGIDTTANPDFHLHEYDALLLDDAHKLKSEQSMKGSATEKKIFLVLFNTMISEAQNALLKTIEEPTPDTHFFFVTRTKEVLVPTVRSRLFLVHRDLNDRDADLKQGEAFLRASIPERLKLVERLTKAKAEEKAAAKEDARLLLDALERALAVRMPHTDLATAQSLADVTLARRYLFDRSPSLKLLFEHLALTLPILRE